MNEKCLDVATTEFNQIFDAGYRKARAESETTIAELRALLFKAAVEKDDYDASWKRLTESIAATVADARKATLQGIKRRIVRLISAELDAHPRDAGVADVLGSLGAQLIEIDVKDLLAEAEATTAKASDAVGSVCEHGSDANCRRCVEKAKASEPAVCQDWCGLDERLCHDVHYGEPCFGMTAGSEGWVHLCSPECKGLGRPANKPTGETR